MALSLVTDAGTIKIPSAVVQANVQSTAGGLGTTGIVAYMGEAASGLSYGEETDFPAACTFGPDQFSDVQAKYGAGPLVAAFVAGTVPANDPDIQGAPQSFVLVKTNVGGSASGTVPNWAATTWGTLQAHVPGADGSLLQRTVTAAVSEVIPTTSAFTFLPPIATTNVDFRINGGAAIAYAIAAQQTPTAFVAGVNALAGVAATGGADRGIIGSVSGTIGIAVVSGNAVLVTRSIAWSVVPTVGDTFFITSGSAIAGGSDQNVGSYVVTAATSTTISATKLLDATGTPSQLTAPVTVAPASIASTTVDARAWGSVTVSLEAGNPVDGVGKSLEVSELTSASGRLSYLAYALSTTGVTWISKTGVPTNLASASEYRADLNIARQKDSLNEDVVQGGEILLQLGYLGTSGSAVVASGVMTITVAGGAGSSPAAISLSLFSTVADLAAYLATLTGFSAAVGSASVAQRPSTDLDAGTFTIGSTFGAKNGRLKGDAAAMKAGIAASGSVRLTGTLPTAGLPAPAAAAFMAGGSKGGTTDAAVAAACVALEGVDANSVTPLFSNDAATDVADALTESSSTYTIAAVHANLRSHILKMATLKNYSPRQGFASIRGTFAVAKAAASNMASFRVAMTFEDVRVAAGSGAVVQQRPWMGAAVAAAFQAAAFRRAIFNKGVNIVGALQAAGDFNPRKPSEVEAALDAGLLVLRPAKGGGWAFVSDQTTYTKDGSFFFNSIQAVYGADIIGRTLQQDLENAIVGQSVADVGRSQVLTILRGSADKLRGLKLIAPSDGAPLGYINEDAKVTPPSVTVSIDVKEATSLYFVRILLNVSAVTQTG